MSYKGQLTHGEKMEAIADCLRDIMALEVTHRNMPTLLNRGKAVSGLIMADIKEQLMEGKRQAVQTIMIAADGKVRKKLKKVKQPKLLDK